MGGDDLLGMILEALGDGEVTTKEASDRLENVFGYRCPDDLAKTFMKYRKAGAISGRVSVERGGWVWSAAKTAGEENRWLPNIRTKTCRPPGATCFPATNTAP